MNRLRLALAASLFFAAVACNRNSVPNGPPSPEFKKAQTLYLELVKNDLDELYSDPKLNDVLALLDKVPATSIDAPTAAKLKEQIAEGITEAQKKAAERKAAVEAATKLPPAPTGPSAVALNSAPADTKPAAAAAPAKPVAGPKEGMSLSEFQSTYGACFSADSNFTDSHGNKGSAYAMSGDALCKSKYPTFADQLVLVTGDKVTQIIDKSMVKGREQLSFGTQPKAAPAAQPQPAQAAPAAPPPPPDPNAVDRKVSGADSKVSVGGNLNSDLDERSKLPGQQ